MSWLDALTWWHWWIIAALLAIGEAFAPGAAMIWYGVAAAVVGLLLLLWPEMAWQIQFLLFAAFSIASVAGWRAWRNRHPEETDYPALNRRGEALVGRIITLEQPIVDGFGKARIDDSTWKLRGPNLPVGSKVRISSVDGTVLIVAQEQESV